MIITDIKQQVKRTDRYSIYVDGKYSFALSEAELAKSGLRKDQELARLDLAKIQKTAVLDKAYDRAVRYISIRPRSQWEVEDYLKRKGYDASVSRSLLDKLGKLGLVDDAAFAKQWVEWRTMGRPRSKRQLAAELYKKRIDREIIKEMLDEIDDEDELKQIREIIGRKSQLTQYQDRQKLISYLARQGYNYGLIKKALKSD